jgi:hypothetical protein
MLLANTVRQDDVRSCSLFAAGDRTHKNTCEVCHQACRLNLRVFYTSPCFKMFYRLSTWSCAQFSYFFNLDGIVFLLSFKYYTRSENNKIKLHRSF